MIKYHTLPYIKKTQQEHAMTTKTRFGRFPARKMALTLAVAIASQALPALAQDDGEVTAEVEREVIRRRKGGRPLVKVEVEGRANTSSSSTSSSSTTFRL